MLKGKTGTIAMIVVVLTASLAGGAFAEPSGILITALGGYQWGGTFNGYYGEAKLNDSGNWGIALDIPVRPDTYVELIYTRQVTDLIYREYGLGTPATEQFDISTEYYHVGGLYTMPKEGPRPFGTMTFGATRFAPQSSVYSSEWLFSVALGVGALVPVSERIGFRLHARLLLPFVYTGGGLWCGGGGCSMGIYGGSTIAQGDIAFGLVIRI